MKTGEMIALAATFALVLVALSVFIRMHDIRMKQLSAVLNKQYEVLSKMLVEFRVEMEKARDVFKKELTEDRLKFHGNYEELLNKNINLEQTALKLFSQVKAWKTPPEFPGVKP